MPTHRDAPVRIGRYRSAIHQNATAVRIQLPQANAEPGLDGSWPRENAAIELDPHKGYLLISLVS